MKKHGLPLLPLAGQRSRASILGVGFLSHCRQVSLREEADHKVNARSAGRHHLGTSAVLPLTLFSEGGAAVPLKGIAALT